MLQDIAIITGGKGPITEGSRHQAEKVQISDLGQVKKITLARTTPPSSKAKAKAQGGSNGPVNIKEFASDHKTTANTTARKLQERLAETGGSVAEPHQSSRRQPKPRNEEKKARVEGRHACNSRSRGRKAFVQGEEEFTGALRRGTRQAELEVGWQRSVSTVGNARLQEPMRPMSKNAG